MFNGLHCDHDVECALYKDMNRWKINIGNSICGRFDKAELDIGEDDKAEVDMIELKRTAGEQNHGRE